jgi:hypothetical protein
MKFKNEAIKMTDVIETPDNLGQFPSNRRKIEIGIEIHQIKTSKNVAGCNREVNLLTNPKIFFALTSMDRP